MAPRNTKFSQSRHTAKAQHNEQFVVDLGATTSGYEDWQVTATFYAAVHWLQTYFVTRTPQDYPTSHQERDSLVQKDSNLVSLWKDYRELKRLATDSRYACIPINSYDVTKALGHLATIRNHIQSLLP